MQPTDFKNNHLSVGLKDLFHYDSLLNLFGYDIRNDADHKANLFMGLMDIFVNKVYFWFSIEKSCSGVFI